MWYERDFAIFTTPLMEGSDCMLWILLSIWCCSFESLIVIGFVQSGFQGFIESSCERLELEGKDDRIKLVKILTWLIRGFIRAPFELAEYIANIFLNL